MVDKISFGFILVAILFCLVSMLMSMGAVNRSYLMYTGDPVLRQVRNSLAAAISSLAMAWIVLLIHAVPVFKG